MSTQARQAVQVEQAKKLSAAVGPTETVKVMVSLTNPKDTEQTRDFGIFFGQGTSLNDFSLEVGTWYRGVPVPAEFSPLGFVTDGNATPNTAGVYDVLAVVFAQGVDYDAGWPIDQPIDDSMVGQDELSIIPSGL